MATTTALQGIPVPQASDNPNGPAQITSVATALEALTVMRFSSAAARTSAFSTAGVTPTNGMLSYRADGGPINGFEYYNATAGQWRVWSRYRDSQTLGSPAASVTFSSIPTYLKTINIYMNARSDAAAAFAGVSYRIGGDSSASYRNVVKFNQNGTWATPIVQSGVTSALCGHINANTTASGLFGVVRLDLIGWDAPKTGTLRGLSQSGFYDSGGTYVLAEASTDYAGSATYTSVTLLTSAGNFVTNSEFVLSGQE